MTKTVLVTGAGGFVGSHLVETILARTEFFVICVDSFRHNGTTDNILQNPRVRVLTHDLTAPFSPGQMRRIGKLDYLINAASKCQVQQSLDDPVGFVTNNVQLVLNVLELAYQKEVKHFIQISTDEVYGPNRPHTSTDHKPSSPYAASKAAQEDICLSYHHSFGLSLTIVNSSNMFGERQSDLAFIPQIIKRLRQGKEVEVHEYNSVMGARYYIYVKNVVNDIVNQLGRPTPRLMLSGTRLIDNVTLVKLVASCLNVPPRYRVVDISEQRPGYDMTYPQLSKYPPPVDLDEGLRRTVDWYLKNEV